MKSIDYSVLNIKGSNGYPIEIKKGNTSEVKVLRSRQNHFKKTLVGDTLFIEFSGSNISKEQALHNETPPGILIENNRLTKIIASNIFCRIVDYSTQDLEIQLHDASIADFVECSMNDLNLLSRDNSQFIFSKNNSIDTLDLTMNGASIGNLNEIEFQKLTHALDDSVILVLSKNTFRRIHE